MCVLNTLWDDVSQGLSVKDIDPYFNAGPVLLSLLLPWLLLLSVLEHIGTYQRRESLCIRNLIRRGHYDVTTQECCSVDEQRAEFRPGKRTLAQRRGVYPPLVLRHDKSIKSALHHSEPRIPCRQSHQNTFSLSLGTHSTRSACRERIFGCT